MSVPTLLGSGVGVFDLVRQLWEDGPRLVSAGLPRILAQHSGPAATLGASVAVALSYRWARKIARVFMEVALCGAVLGALTHFGVLHW